MDETAFRQARAAIVDRPCAFEKALLTGCGTCSRAQRRNIAERETIDCRDAEAHAGCAALLGLLRQQATFTLHLTRPEPRLPHAQEMKVQCGGLAGLQRALTGVDAVGDVAELVRACGAANGPEGLPWPAIVRSVATWQPRRRARRS